MAKMTLEQIKALAAAARETATDMTEVQKGGKARLLPEGYSLAYITGYIELGMQPQTYEGKAKNPAPEFVLRFSLLDEGYCNEDGTPYSVETFSIAESRNEKAKAFKLFKLLNWQNQHKCWIDLIGELIMVKIEHYKGGPDKKETKSRVALDGFLPPLDPRSKKPYDAAPLPEEDLVVFLWDYPTLENWDSLRDFHKQDALKALNFPGSELEGLLIENGRPLKVEPRKGEEAPKEEEAPQESQAAADTSGMAMPSPE